MSDLYQVTTMIRSWRHGARSWTISHPRRIFFSDESQLRAHLLSQGIPGNQLGAGISEIETTRDSSRGGQPLHILHTTYHWTGPGISNPQPRRGQIVFNVRTGAAAVILTDFGEYSYLRVLSDGFTYTTLRALWQPQN